MELKPCPVCKTDDYVYVVPSLMNNGRFICICNVCGLGEEFPDHDTEKEAEAEWNRRVEHG